jgi:predicted  nucleic acid-binding Zn-ribbon protein
MPFSLDPQPAENEFECANCGALIYDQLTRCPNCGVNLYEPEEESESNRIVSRKPQGFYRSGNILDRTKEFLRRI